ncbi:BPI fold-containing family B member 1 isoform X2 [Monodelphis domestica]|uniref:BPI fold-containing family B member 1 isoform X2 n=1 Tax=Monodelphis domestica TaxID=13616 RepID=UPI0024E1E402|nr:BPI fold-containing family B member 1 isoform X2 [Monodelphis domestica]
MLQPWGLALLWGFLIMSSVQAEPEGQGLLNISPKLLKKIFLQEFDNQDTIQTLKDLPLYDAMKNNYMTNIPVIGNVVGNIMTQIIGLQVNTVNIKNLDLKFTESDRLRIKIPFDMVAGLNLAITDKLIEMRIESDIIAEIRTVIGDMGQSHLVFSYSTESLSNLQISLLQKFSFTVNYVANSVIELLLPALPKLLKKEICPVVQKSIVNMADKIENWPTLPMPFGQKYLTFEVLKSSLVDNSFQLDLNAKLLGPGGKLIKVFNESKSEVSQKIPKVGAFDFSFVIRQDVVNAIFEALLPPEELMVLLDTVLPEIARQLKSVLNKINPTAHGQLESTQIVKLLNQEFPQIILKPGSVKLSQLVVFEVFPNNRENVPLFTLAIETSSDGQFFTEGNKLFFNLLRISTDRIHLMNSSTGMFSSLVKSLQVYGEESLNGQDCKATFLFVAA